MRVHGYEFPDELYYSVAHDMWARRDANGWVTIGATALGVVLAGEIVAFLPKPAGEMIEQDRSLGAMELFKTILPVRSPISGTIMETNRRLESTPGLINRDPYGKGWLLRMQPAAWDRESAGLVHGDAVAAALEHALGNYRELGYDV